MTAPLKLHDYACAKVRRRLDSYLTGELSVDLSHEILEHVDRCPECRTETHARENLRASFRRVAASTPEPREGFEGEVRALLARTPMRRALPASLLLAASLVAVGGVTGWLVLSRAAAPEAAGPSPIASLDAAAADFAALEHKNCARAASWPREAASAEEFTRGLDAPLASAAQSAAARLPGYAPVSAHECDHAGETVFHLILRRRGDGGRDGLVSVVITHPGSALAARSMATADVATATRLGFSVAGARVADGRLVLVAGSADEKTTLTLERAVLPAFAAAVASR